MALNEYSVSPAFASAQLHCFMQLAHDRAASHLAWLFRRERLGLGGGVEEVGVSDQPTNHLKSARRRRCGSRLAATLHRRRGSAARVGAWAAPELI